MSWIDGLKHRVRTLFDPAGHERDVADEMRHHLELDAQQQGDASRARRRFGNRTYYQEETRRMTWLGSLDVLRQDVGYAWRSIRRAPGFTLMVVVTLSLGLGANAATFTLIDQLLLRPPAGVDNPEAVQKLWWETSGGRSYDGQPFNTTAADHPSYRAVVDAIGEPRSFARYMTDYSLYMRDGESRQRVRGVFATASYFHVLGVTPALGRVYTASEDSLGAGAPVVVIGHRFWRRAFGSDSTVLGRRVKIESDEYEIIGVLEEDFEGLDIQAVDVWIPLASIPSTHWMVTSARARSRGGNWWDMHWGSGVSSLRRPSRADESPEDFSRNATLALRNHKRAVPQGDTLAKVQALPLTGPGLAKDGPDNAISKRIAWVAAVVLVIACANVINLLLARAVRRKREIAVRLAMGISRERLVRLLATETVLLGLIAGGVSLFVACGGGVVLRALLLPNVVFYQSPLHWRVIVFAIATSAIAGLVAGIIPAIQASKPDLTVALKEGVRDGTVHRSRLRRSLVVAQAALSMVLLVGAVLFIRSLTNVRALDLGYDTRQVLFGSVRFEAGQRPAREVLSTALSEVAQRVDGRDGVEGVALTVFQPMRGLADGNFYFGSDSSYSLRPNSPTFLVVSSAFFRTVGMRILTGTTFQDGAGAPRELVINETMAKRVWPNGDALGQCLRFEKRDNPCYTVVGIVENGRQGSVIEDPKPLYYLPLGNAPWGSYQAGSILVRARAEAVPAARAELTGALRGQFARAEIEVKTMDEALEPEYRMWRVGALLFAGFGLLALVVAVVGVYSTVSYGVTQRTHEFGVRVALGARVRDVLRLVVGEGVRVVAIGVVVGVALALAAGKLVASLLYGVAPHDPLTMTLVGVTLLAVAALAALIPAWRASRVDPVTALRAD